MNESPATNTSSADLNIHGPHDAGQLDTLIRHLAKLRATLLPAVPLHPGDGMVLLEDQPALSITARRGGGFRLHIRHRGFGWQAYNVDAQTAASMGSAISRNIKDGATVDLIRHEEPHRH